MKLSKREFFEAGKVAMFWNSDVKGSTHQLKLGDLGVVKMTHCEREIQVP